MARNWKTWLAVGIVGLLALIAFAETYPLALLAAGACALAGKMNRRAWWAPAALAALCAWLMAYAAAGLAGLPRYDFSSGKVVRGQVLPVTPAAWVSVEPANAADRAGRLGLVLGAGAGLALAGWARRRGRVHDEKHVHGLKVADSAAKGTGRWAGDADLAHVAEFGPPKEGERGGGTVVGKLKGRVVRIRPQKREGAPPIVEHACVTAGTGGGKSYSFVIPNAVAAAMEEESLILTDPKGELACTLGPWLRDRDYKVFLFNLAWPQWSSCWNPVLECKDDEEITAFATAIVMNAAKEKSGYFLMKEIQLLKALVYLLRADFPKEQAHLRAALSLLSWPQEDLDARFEKAYREGRLPQAGYEEWRGAVSSNYDNAVSGLSAKLNVVRSEPVAKLLSRHEIDMSLFGREKAALFCVLPIGSVHLKPVLAAFYYFFFRRLMGLAAESGGRLPRTTRFLLDEFANVGEVPGFVEVISTARGMGIKIQFVLQGLKQLHDVYGAAEAEAILSNCPIQLFLGGDDLTTTRYFSQRLGEAAVYAVTERHDVTMPWDRLEVPKRTETVVRRPLMEPEELSRMDPMAAVCLVRWCLPLYLEKYGWHELPQAPEIREKAARSLAQVLPARPDLKVELPKPPEPKPKEKEVPDRDQERGGKGRKAGQEPEPDGKPKLNIPGLFKLPDDPDDPEEDAGEDS